MSTGKTIAKLLIAIGVSVDGAKKAEDEINGTTEAAENTDKKGSSKLKAFAAAAKVAFGGVAVAAAAASGAILAAGGAAFAFANNQTQAMDEVAKGAQKLGLGADEFQRLGQVADQTGTSMEHFGGGIRRLNAEMLNVANGAGEAFEQKLAMIGLSAEQLQGKSTTDQIGMIGDALQLIESDAERAARAAAIFGEDAGPGMANILAAGTESLREMSAAAEGVFTDDELAKAEEFQASLKSFQHLLGGVAGDLAIALAPAITAVVDTIRQFISENEDLIKQQLPKILTLVLDSALKLLPVMLDIAGAVADLVIQAEPLINQFVDFTSGSLERGMKGVLAVLENVLPVVLAIASAITEAVGGVGMLDIYSKTGGKQYDEEDPFGKNRQQADVTKLREKSKTLANEGWARDRKLSQQEIEAELLGRWKRGEINTLDEGVKQLQEDFDPVLTFAEMAQREKAKKAQRDAKAAEDKKNRPKGARKPKESKEMVEASFGDYRDVLLTYQGKGPEEAKKALESLEKGVMPKDHRPETSINITNHMTYHIDVGGISVSGAQSPAGTAKEINAALKAEFRKVSSTTPNNIVR